MTKLRSESLKEEKLDEPHGEPSTGLETPKKESAPNARGDRYFLFELLDEGTFQRIDSYPNPKAFREGVKQRVRAISDNKKLPNWTRFRGEFKPVKVERIKDVKVKL